MVQASNTELINDAAVPFIYISTNLPFSVFAAFISVFFFEDLNPTFAFLKNFIQDSANWLIGNAAF